MEREINSKQYSNAQTLNRNTEARFATNDLLVFSHLRWGFVFQRPQHLMTRFSNYRRVFFIEEPIFEMIPRATLEIRKCETSGVNVVIPHFPFEFSPITIEVMQTQLLESLLEDEKIEEYSCWYYTPMALAYTRHLKPLVLMYDCMDELSLFKGAPESLIQNERELLSRADLVFTGGHSLYQAKKHLHKSIFPFPSSIDKEHFGKARYEQDEPQDQTTIPFPRFGFFGVIDERFDIDLLKGMADLRPDWQFVILGPVVKIDPQTLPQRSNIHYLGQKSYQELPRYIAGWNGGIMPFALNDSTKFISPTKTPEYLAAGKPVVCTPIQDVVFPYGAKGLVHIATTPEDFVEKCELALQETEDDAWLAQVDDFLEDKSWDNTWEQIAELEKETLRHSRRFELSRAKERASTGLFADH